MSTLLRDVLDIPERAGAEDYVLRLTDSVGHEAVRRTLEEYVVTDALVEAFDQALGLVGEAIGSGVSRGAFLTGSFGSGKSHFMAVLHALLRNEPAARGKAELQPVVAKHDPQLGGRTVLPLAFHLIGADSLEQAIFDGYVRQVSALHPGAPLPPVHKTDMLLEDAEGFRERMGDEAFFAALNGAEPGDAADTQEPDPWGNVLSGGRWDAERYHEARAAAREATSRQELVSTLVETLFRSFTRQAEFVDLDTGLHAIAGHAKGLGYDAVVLFLDELVLWLAFSVQDREFFRRESQKLTKLVESSVGGRAVPLVSFVARQMDLRRWFADAGASGAEQEALDRAFRHQEGRFATIALGDDNLPYVANRRLLRPKDAEGAAELEAAFRRIDRRADVWDVLLDGVNTDERHRGADEEAFRLTYPFSPALVSTLRSLASVMQRERTALKVMQQMLVDRRDTLTVDDVIPVGDSFDRVVEGHEALDPQAAALFNGANKLYTEKLRPLLLRNHGIEEATLRDAPETVPPAYRTDDRLAKTLLLSAVAPKVPALKALTAARLASLNHGSIVSPLPGGEAAVVLAKVRMWARDVPEIHLEGEDRNPSIRVQLSDVDYESVVERAKGEDNDGRRRQLLRDLVSDALGLELGQPDVQGAYRHEVVWRGSRRSTDLLFGNVRDQSWLSEGHFRDSLGTWRVVLDHPFDEPGHSAREDLDRLEGMQARDFSARTVVWLPRFLSDDKIRELRRLVILNWLLEGSTGDRWRTNADHLSETDRALAKGILESQRSTLRRSLEDAIQQAYGAAAPRAGTLVDDPSHDRVLVSLDRSFAPVNPVGATLGAAFENLLSQAFEATFPAHPRFEPCDVEVRVRDLKAVAAHVARAVADPEKRVELQGDVAAVRRIAGPLGVGTATEMHYLLGDDRFSPWGQEIERALGRREQEKGVGPHDPVTVAELRAWIDAVRPPHGLRPEVADLVMLTWAALRQRAWFLHGAALASVPDPGQLTPAMELRTQPMPSDRDWAAATARAGALLGVVGATHLTAPAVADFERKVTDAAGRLAADAPTLVAAVEAAYRRVGVEHGARLNTATATGALVSSLKQLRGVELVSRLASADLGDATANAAGRSLTWAGPVAAALNGFEWARLDPLHRAMTGEGTAADEAADIVNRLRSALQHDELVTPAAGALEAAEDGLFRWLTRHLESPGPPPQPAPGPPPREPEVPLDDEVVRIDPPPVTVPHGRQVRRAGEGKDEEVLDALTTFLDHHRGVDVEVTWRVVE